MNGAIVITENISGKIISLVGGYNNINSVFNRATQAKRQAGSLFKILRPIQGSIFQIFKYSPIQGTLSGLFTPALFTPALTPPPPQKKNAI